MAMRPRVLSAGRIVGCPWNLPGGYQEIPGSFRATRGLLLREVFWRTALCRFAIHPGLARLRRGEGRSA